MKQITFASIAYTYKQKSQSSMMDATIIQAENSIKDRDRDRDRDLDLNPKSIQQEKTINTTLACKSI